MDFFFENSDPSDGLDNAHAVLTCLCDLLCLDVAGKGVDLSPDGAIGFFTILSACAETVRKAKDMIPTS